MTGTVAEAWYEYDAGRGSREAIEAAIRADERARCEEEQEADDVAHHEPVITANLAHARLRKQEAQ